MGWPYFTDKEVEGLQTKIIQKLVVGRHISGCPYRITSGLRTAQQNQKAGGVSDSSHLSGLAVDLRANDSRERFFIIRGLIAAGFNRIGVYDHHVHVDDDRSLDQDVMWLGTSH